MAEEHGWAGKGARPCPRPEQLSQWPHTVSTCSLQNVSFSLSPGKVTALVGPSGSGKSSCVNILENFYPLEGGCVLLDGKPISAYDHKYLHRVVCEWAFGVPLCSLCPAVTLVSHNAGAEK